MLQTKSHNPTHTKQGSVSKLPVLKTKKQPLTKIHMAAKPQHRSRQQSL